MINKTIFNRAPLASNELAALPLGAIRPQQWLKEQLERAASGLTGRLDDFWPSVKDSAWRGGKGDGWERAPYYLDGLIPLAWLLGDAHLKEKAMRYIDWTRGHPYTFKSEDYDELMNSGCLFARKFSIVQDDKIVRKITSAVLNG